VIPNPDPINRTYALFFEKPLVYAMHMENMVTFGQHSYLVTLFEFIEAKALVFFQ
jgi:hypothetical protein